MKTNELLQKSYVINIFDTDVLRDYGVKALTHDCYQSVSVIPLGIIHDVVSGGTSGANQIAELVEGYRLKLAKGSVELDARHELILVGLTPCPMMGLDGQDAIGCAQSIRRYLDGQDGSLTYVRHVRIVSNDLRNRLVANAKGIEAVAYRPPIMPFGGKCEVWHDGVSYGSRPSPRLAHDIIVESDAWTKKAYGLSPYHQLVEVRGADSKAVPLVKDGYNLSQLYGVNKTLDGVARNDEQRVALRYLMDDSIQMVALSGVAGGGKTYLSLYAGLLGMRSGKYKHILAFRPMYAVGGQELGTLPGDKDDKFSPWQAAIKDNLDALNVQPKERQEIFIDPLSYIRGRTLADMLVIVDDAQSLDKSLILDIMTRLGDNAKLVLTYDLTQMDHVVRRENSVQAVVDEFISDPAVATIGFTRTQRSHLASLAASSLVRTKFSNWQ